MCGNPRKLFYTTDGGDESLLFPFTVVVIITFPNPHLPLAAATVNSNVSTFFFFFIIFFVVVVVKNTTDLPLFFSFRHLCSTFLPYCFIDNCCIQNKRSHVSKNRKSLNYSDDFFPFDIEHSFFDLFEEIELDDV